MGATSELFIQMQDQVMQTISKAEDGIITNLDAVIDLREKRQVLDDTLALIKQYEYEQLEQIESEAKDYNNEYKGYKFEFRNGRQMFSFKSIPQWQKLEADKKSFEDQAKTAFKLYQKTGSRPITEDGEELPLPEVNYGKSSLVIKKK